MQLELFGYIDLSKLFMYMLGCVCVCVCVYIAICCVGEPSLAGQWF